MDREFLLWLSGLRSQHSLHEDVGLIPSLTQVWCCHKLGCRSQIGLGSLIAVALATTSSCISDLTLSPGNFHMPQVQSKKKKKKKKKKKIWLGIRRWEERRKRFSEAMFSDLVIYSGARPGLPMKAVADGPGWVPLMLYCIRKRLDEICRKP